MKIAINDIIVPEERQRSDMGDLKELMKSIEQIGLIQPIVLDENNGLIAGERRLRAHQMLFRNEIDAIYIRDLSPDNRHLIELEENVKRKALTWPEHVEAVKRYHELRLKLNPEQTKVATAEELGLSQSKLAKDLLVAAELEKQPELAEVKKYQSAYRKTVRTNERARDVEISKIDLGFGPAVPKDRKLQLLNADFHEWAASYSGPLFDFIHCDFPYGINLQRPGTMMNKDEYEMYDDSPEVYRALIETLGKHADRFMAPNAHIMFWYATKEHAFTRKLLFEAGFRTQPTPLIWVKSDQSGVAPDPRYNPRHIYETALIAYRGDRKIAQVKSDAIMSPPTKLFHPSEKPMPVLRHFFELFVDKHTLLLDPTCGSGNAISVGEEMGAKHSLGLEISEPLYQDAKRNLKL